MQKNPSINLTQSPRSGTATLQMQSILAAATPSPLDEERAQFIKALVDDGYTYDRFDRAPLVADLLLALKRDGFLVFPNGKQKMGGTAKGTIRVESNGHYVGYAPHGEKDPELLMGLPYVVPGTSRTKQAWPSAAAVHAYAAQWNIPFGHLVAVVRDGQPYARVTDVRTATALVHLTAQMVDPDYMPPDAQGREATLEHDIRVIRAGLSQSTPATCERLVQARRGQGRFRTEVMRAFGGRCAVSRLGLGAALRASHIVSWKLCVDDQERLDPCNGLLLSADLDALFDKYLITFDAQGKLLRSPRLDAHLQHHWPLADLARRPAKRQASYLERHNAVFDRLRLVSLCMPVTA